MERRLGRREMESVRGVEFEKMRKRVDGGIDAFLMEG